MSKIKNDLRGMGKILQIFPDITIRKIKKTNSIISPSKSAQILEKISRNIDKSVTAKQSQIIFDVQRILAEQVGLYCQRKASLKHK